MKWFWRIALGLALVLAGLFTWNHIRELNAQLQDARLQQQTALQQSGYALSQELQALELRLSKAPLCDAPEDLSALLMDVSSRAQGAAQSLALLPMDPDAGQAALAFLQRSSDYAASLVSRAAQGQPLASSDLELLSSIRRACLTLQEAAQSMDFSSIDETLTLSLPQDTDSDELYPVMIYDGPFSETEQTSPVVGLTGEEATRQEAITRAAQLLSVDEALVTVEGEELGDMPGWILGCGQTRLLLSRTGLQLLWLLSESEQETAALTSEDAVQAARDFCQSLGLDVPSLTWSQQYNGCMVVCLAPQQDGAILYPDLVKVKISLTDAKILGFDARRYYRSHTQRDLPEPGITREQAQSLAPGALEVDGCSLAFIEPNGSDAALTWELRGLCQGERFYVYLNAQTGEIEEILREVTSAQGGAAA